MLTLQTRKLCALAYAHPVTLEKLIFDQKAAVERAGPQVKYVDWDPYAGKFHGRYCEAGVNETSSESNERYITTPYLSSHGGKKTNKSG